MSQRLRGKWLQALPLILLFKKLEQVYIQYFLFLILVLNIHFRPTNRYFARQE